MSPRRWDRWLALFAATSWVAVLWVWTDADSMQRDAHSSHEALGQTHDLAQQIQAARNDANHTESGADIAAELGRRLESHIAELDMPLSVIRDVNPQPERRLGDSVMVQRVTRIDLRPIDLPRLARLMQRFHTDPGLQPPVTITHIRLTAPRVRLSASSNPMDGDEPWEVDLGLTQTYQRPPETQP